MRLKPKKVNYSKSPVTIVGIDKIDKILLSDKFPYNKSKRYCFQYFVGYKNDEQINPLCIKPAKNNGHVNSFKGTKYIPFLIKNYPLLKKYYVILKKIAILREKDLKTNRHTMENT